MPATQLWTFADRFQESRSLHESQAGRTSLGLDLLTRQNVIIKSVASGNDPSGSQVQLEREATVLKTLRRDAPIAFGIQGNTWYLVRPYLPGISLDRRLEIRRLTFEEGWVLADSLIQDLKNLHSHGIHHGRLQPNKIIVDESYPLSRANLFDFDSEMASGALDVSVEWGRYLSPEQLGLLSSRVVDWRSDLYAVGVVLYECLAGEPAFSGDSVNELLRQKLNLSLPRLKGRVPGYPEAFDEILQQLTHKDPLARYQSAAGVEADLKKLRSRLREGNSDSPFLPGLQDHPRPPLGIPKFVGRNDELERLDASLSKAAGGSPQILFVEAPSGGGKTQLLKEWVLRQESHSQHAFWGHGLQGVAKIPFRVLSEVVSKIPDLERAQRDLEIEDIEAICASLPELSGKLRFGTSPVSAGPEHSAENRTITALSRFLNAIGRTKTPTVLILDDYQWADSVTTKVLRHWLTHFHQNKTNSRILIVLSFRTEEVPDSHPLRQITPDDHLVLSALNAQDTNTLIRSMVGATSDEVTSAVLDSSSGNPFLSVSILQGMWESGAIKPAPARWEIDPERAGDFKISGKAGHILSRRIAALPQDCLRLAQAGAILGRTFDLRRAGKLAGQDTHWALRSAEDCQRRQILTIETGQDALESPSFVHDKIRESLLEGLSEKEKKSLHLRAAEIIGTEVPARFYDLAYHFDSAGMPEEAFEHSIQAAKESRTRYDLELAETYCRIAVRGVDGKSADLRRANFEEFGTVLMLRGNYPEAETWFIKAQAIAATPLARAMIGQKLGELAFKRSNLAGAAEFYESALGILGHKIPHRNSQLTYHWFRETFIRATFRLFPEFLRSASQPPEETRLVMHLLSSLHLTWWYQGGVVRGLWSISRAHNLGARFHLCREMAAVYTMISIAYSATRFPFVRKNLALHFGRKAIHAAQANGDLWSLGRAKTFFGFGLLVCGRIEEAEAELAEAGQLLAKSGDLWETNNATLIRSVVQYNQGKLRESAESARTAYKLGLEIREPQAVGISLKLWSLATNGQVPAELIEKSRASAPKEDLLTQTHLQWAEAIRKLRVEQRPDQAAEILGAANGILAAVGIQNELVLAQFLDEVMALRIQGELLPAHASRSKELLFKKALSKLRGMRKHFYLLPNHEGYFLREMALLHLNLGRRRRALRLLAKSVKSAERQGMNLDRARSLKAKALLEFDLGLPDASRSLEEANLLLFRMEGPALSSTESPTLSVLDRFHLIMKEGRTIASALNRRSVYSAITDAFQSLLRVDNCQVFEVSDNSKDFWKVHGNPTLSYDSESIERAISTQAPTILSKEIPGSSEARSILSAPILVKGKVAVCLQSVHREISGLFGDEEERIAYFITSVAGAALENTLNFQEAQRAARLRQEFLALASHELRTPLTPLTLEVGAYSRKLKKTDRESIPREEVLQAWSSISGHVQRVTRLVGEILEASELRSGENQQKARSPLDLVSVVSECLRDLEGERMSSHSRISFRHPPLLAGNWNPPAIKRALTNLLSVAIRYGKGKPIEVIVEAPSSTEARVLITDHGATFTDQIRFRIEDRLKDPEVLDDYGGLGISLYRANQIIEAHDGSIRIDPTPDGSGVTYVVSLPV